MSNQYVGRHRLEHGGETVSTIIRRATFTGPEWLAKILAWPNPFLAPTMPAVAPGNAKAERHHRNSFGAIDCTCVADKTVSNYCGLHGDPTAPGGDCK